VICDLQTKSQAQITIASRKSQIEKVVMVKAVRVHSFGDPSVLRYEEIPEPIPKPGEAVVQIDAAGVNFIDVVDPVSDIIFTLRSSIFQSSSDHQCRDGR
jgi:hypothetical protein